MRNKQIAGVAVVAALGIGGAFTIGHHAETVRAKPVCAMTQDGVARCGADLVAWCDSTDAARADVGPVTEAIRTANKLCADARSAR